MNQFTPFNSLMDMKSQLSPEEFAKSLQKHGDLFWSEDDKMWIVTSYACAKKILASDDFTSDRMSYFKKTFTAGEFKAAEKFFAVVSQMMIMSDPPKHTARKRICFDGFTHQTLSDLEPRITKAINTKLSKCIHKGCIELVNDFAKSIPSIILAEFFHIPESERDLFYECSNHMTQFFGRPSQEIIKIKAVNQSAKQLYDYFNGLIQQRRQRPNNDFLSILIQNQSAFKLSDEEIISQAVMMLVAGQVTTTDQLCNNMYTLISSQTNTNELLTNSLSLNQIIEELTRLDPAVSFIYRLAKKECLIENQKIQKGDVIFISTHAANRDPKEFAQPHQCHFGRTNRRHLSFGFGPHFCLGAKLAQLEMQHCFHALLKQLPNVQFNKHNHPKRKHHSLAFSGFEHMMLQFD